MGDSVTDQPDVTAFFEPVTSTVTYVVADPPTGRCAIVDTVLDYDPRSGRTSTASADRVIDDVRRRGLVVDWVLETHVHADHITAAPYVRERLGGRTGIGARLPEVQRVFRSIYNLGDGVAVDGSQYDRLFADDEVFRVGGLPGRVLHTPGHTPGCVCYLIGDAVFVGDLMLMPDYGTARCDFPGGDAATLYRSVRRLLALPPQTRMFVAHDYAPGGRPVAWEATVGAQRRGNIHVREGVGERDFVALRKHRDAELELPTQMLPAIQVNIRGGHLPPPEDNGVVYLKIPLNRF